jgi:peptidoglycan-associated lipoprotein
MTLTPKALLLLAALTLAACQEPRPLRRGRRRRRRRPRRGGRLVDTTGLGDPSDPRSIAYFNQTVGDRVLFAVDQSTLSPEARGILQAQANWLAQNPGYAIIIEGHADEQGTREYNLALGARRAAAVQPS